MFRNPAATSLIKRCNDFGAGGVSVAIGELADGLVIDLDKVPKKYEGLDGTELAISESQERMAVVVAKDDAEAFINLAKTENLDAVHVADVTAENRLVMTWRGKTICDISRDFLNTNGVTKNTNVNVLMPDDNDYYFKKSTPDNIKDAWLNTLSDLNVCSQKGLSERFDASIGAGSVLMPFGGKKQLTPTEGMAAKVPVLKGETNTATIMTFGYNPYISSWSPFHGSIYAVVESFKKGTYENTFGIYEFGAYGKCSGNTIKKLKADVEALKKDSIFTDPNNESIVYKTVTIGNQTWFAENLKVKPVSETASAAGAGKTEKLYACLDGEETCNVVGYTWDVAMGNLDGSEFEIDEVELPVQGLCPEGWHVPSSYEWRNLMIAVSKKYADEIYGSAAGMFAPPYDEVFAANVLFSQEGWPEGNAGWNLVGFDLKPTYGVADGYWGYFWTSDSYGDDAAAIYAGTEGMYFNYIDDAEELSKQESAPVRCVRTEDGVDYTMGLRR